MTFFERGYLTKEIPQNFAVAKNSGSAPLNSLQSLMNSLDLEFLATGSGPYRYPLEKNGHGRKNGLLGTRQEQCQPYLNVTMPLRAGASVAALASKPHPNDAERTNKDFCGNCG